MRKIKIEELLNEITLDALREALGTAKPQYKGATDRELSLIFGLTETQFEHFTKDALSRFLTDALLRKMEEQFLQGNTINFANLFGVSVYESSVYKNEIGLPKKKLSVVTRGKIKEKLNA
jgi:hypothetical protein